MNALHRVSALAVALTAFTACSVEPTNAWDPETPVGEQQEARVIGRVVLPSRDLEQRPVELVVLQNGRLLEQDGSAKVFRTRTEADGLPAGWRDDGRAGAEGTFDIPLPPGTWSVLFSAERNGEVLYDDAATPNLTLSPGETAFQRLRPAPISSDRFEGVVKGTVEGLSPGLSYVVRLVPVAGDLEERTLVRSGDNSFQFNAVVPGTSYRVRIEGDGYAPAVSSSFEVTDEHSSANPLVVAPLRLVSIGELFEVAFDDTGTEAPYVGDARVPVRLAAAQIFLQSSDEQGLHHAEIRALPEPLLLDILADEALGTSVDGRWSEVGGDAQLDVDLAEGLAEAGDGSHRILAQLRLCMQEECECPADAPLSACTPPLMSGIAELSVTLDTEAPALVEADVAGVVARASADAAPLLVVNCARFGAGCPVAAEADPYAPLVEVQVNDRTGRVSGWAVTLDDEAAPSTFTQLASSPGLASFSGLSPGIAPADGNRTLRVWARDAANNVGLVHERTVVVDVTPLELADPALSLTGTEPYDSEGQALEIIPGDLVTVDVVTTGEQPVRWTVRRSDGPLLTGLPAGALAPYEGPISAFVSGVHADVVTLQALVEDSAGNVSTTAPRDLRLWRTGRVLGSVVLEGGGAPSDLLPALIDADGERVQGDAFGDGTFSFATALRGVYTLELEVPGFTRYERSGVVVQAARDTVLAPVQMALPRGDLVGRFELEGREGASTNTGIQVSLLNQGGDAVSGTTTLADGTYRFRDIPAGTGYVVVGAFEGYVPAEFPGVAVAADAETPVNPGDDGAPTPVLLRELVGDFRLCAPSGVLSDSCEPLLWTRLTTVDVGGVDLSGINAYRVGTAPFSDDGTGWQPVTLNGLGEIIPPQVTLGGDGEGRYTVYLQLRVDETNTGEPLTAEIVYDATAPSAVQLVLRKGARALLDGFTSDSTVTVSVNADAGSGDVAPLGDAFVQFANSAPTTPPPSTRCSHGGSCGVPLDDVQERLHSAWAFSCDAAGNCSDTPVQGKIVYDVTPPRALHGVTLTPSSAAIRQSGGVTYTRSAQYSIDVNVGAAENAAGVAVLDAAGAPVADVVGYRFGVAEVPPSGNGSFAFDGIAFSQFTSLLVADATLTAAGPSLPGVEAPYRVYAQLQDAAGNVTVLEDNPFHFDLVLDETAPGATFELNHGADFTRDPVVSLDTTASAVDPPVTARISTDNGLFDAYVDRSYPFEPGEDTWNLGASVADGAKTVYVRFLDAAGNASERSDSIFLDRTAPQPLLVSCSTCSFHAGLAYTNDPTRQVVLDLLATDNSGWVELVDVSGLGAPAPYAAILAVTLPSTSDGSQNLDVSFLDPAGNRSALLTLPVVLDRGAPTPTLTINGGASATGDATVQLSIAASDATSPVVGMRLSNSAAYAGEIQPVTPEVAWTLAFPDTDAPKTVYLEVYDAAGNRAETAAGITLDTAPPTGTVTLAGGAARTNALTVDVALGFSADAVTHVLSTTPLDASCATAAFPATDTPPPATTQVTFAATETEEPEARSLYVCTRDRAGNVAMTFDTIVLDQSGPAGSLVIEDGAPYATAGTVSVAIVNAPSDTTEMKTAVNSAPNCGVSTGYAPFSSSFSASLANTSGTQTVYACLKDSAGNALGTPLFDRIIRDRQPPAVTLTLDGGAAYSASSVITLNVSASDDLTGAEGGVTGMRVANNTVPTSGAFEAFQGARTWTVDAPGVAESKTVCVEVQDAAGRSASACDSIVLDLANPTGSVTLAGGAGYTTSTTVSARFVGDGGAGYQYQYSEAVLDCGATSGWAAFDGDETVDVALGGDGFQEVYACFREPSGRTTLASDGIVVDTAAPTAPQPTSPDADAWVASAKPTFRWSAASGADLYRLTLRDSTNTVVLGPVDVFTTEHTPAADLPAGALTWSVVARDNAGNASGVGAGFPRALNVDVLPPTGLGNLSVQGGTMTNDPTPTLGWSTASDTQTAAADLVYTLQVADGASFSAILLTAELQNTSAAANMTYTLEAPLGEGSYAWRVRVADRAGNSATVTASAFSVDVTPPAAPAFESVASPTTSPLSLNWTAVAGADAYRVQVAQNGGQSGCGAFTPVNTLTATTTYNLVAPSTAGCFYTARVSSTDALGNESAPASVGFLVDTEAPVYAALPPPVLIEGGAAAVSSEVITLALNASGATQVRIKDYESGNCLTPPTPTAAQLAAVTAQPYSPVVTWVLPPNNAASNTGPAPSDECKWIAVSFGDDAGNFTTPSTTQMDGILLDTLAPDAPQIGSETAVVDATSITLALAQDAVDHHFASYQLRNSALQSSWVNATPISSSCLTGGALCSFTVPLRSNTENRISVRALDTAGTPSAEDFVVIREDSSAPLPPSSLKLTPSDRRIDVSWIASSASDLAGYRLYYGTNTSAGSCSSNGADYTGRFAEQGASPIDVGSNTSFTLTGVPNGVEVCVGVLAYDETESPGPQQSSLTRSSVTTWELSPVLRAELSYTQLGIASTSDVGALALKEGILYVAANGEGLIELDVSNEDCFDLSDAASFASCTSRVEASTAMTTPRDIALSGAFAFVADSSYGVYIYRIQTTGAPAYMGRISLAGASAVAANGDVLAVGRTGGYSLYNLASLRTGALPALTQSISSTNAYDVDLQHDLMALGNGNAITLYRVSSAGIATALATQCATGINQEGVKLSGRTLYTGHTSDDIEICDLSTTSGGQYVAAGGVQTDRRWRLEVSGPYLYVTSRGGVTVVDVSDRYSPRLVGSYQHAGSNNTRYGAITVDGYRVFYSSGLDPTVRVLHTGTPNALELVRTDSSALGTTSAELIGDSIINPASASQVLHARMDGIEIDDEGPNIGEMMSSENAYVLSFNNTSYYVSYLGETGGLTSLYSDNISPRRPVAGVLMWPYAVMLTYVNNSSSHDLRIVSYNVETGGLAGIGTIDAAAAASFYSAGSQVALYKGHVFVVVNTAVSDSSEGIWRASVNNYSGVLSTPVQVVAHSDVRGVAASGHGVWWWTQGNYPETPELHVHRGHFPNAWSAANISSLPVSLADTRLRFDGGYLYAPANSSGLDLLQLTYDGTSYKPTSLSAVTSFPSGFALTVMTAGDRVYVSNYVRPFEILRLR